MCGSRTGLCNPLTYAEPGSDYNAEKALTHGTLPLSVTKPDTEGYLTTYAGTYLNGEIRAEALTRSVVGKRKDGNPTFQPASQ